MSSLVFVDSPLCTGLSSEPLSQPPPSFRGLERLPPGLCLIFCSARRSPPPPPTKVTIVGENEICKRENLVGPFLVHKLFGPQTPPPLLPLSTAPPPPPRANLFSSTPSALRLALADTPAWLHWGKGAVLLGRRKRSLMPRGTLGPCHQGPGSWRRVELNVETTAAASSAGRGERS